MEAAPQPSQSTAPQTGPVVPRGRRWRLVLAVAAGVVALLCFGGAGVAFVMYDSATEIDRSSPRSVVSDYLRAQLKSRDDAEASLYVCESTDLAALAEFRRDTETREQQYSTRIAVNWERLEVREADNSATVEADITRRLGAEASDLSRWQFQLRNQDGWRVCEASKVS